MSHQASDIITPKALLLDERLTPLERNAWLTFRALASSDDTVVLSYDALRGYLPSAPGSKRAALETVSRAVLCLRLSTWIALVEYRRNPMTGFSMASRYAVRNQPLAFDDACMKDEDYLLLLERALGHASATIRQLAQSILDEAMRHPDKLEKLPTAMRERIRRLQHRGDDHDPGSPGGSTVRDALVPEASGGIPKPVPASATTVRTVEKEVLKEVRTAHQPKCRYRGRMCQPASGNCRRISNGFSPRVSGACLRSNAWRCWPSGTRAANQVVCTTSSPTSTG